MVHIATNTHSAFSCFNWLDKSCHYQRVLTLQQQTNPSLPVGSPDDPMRAALKQKQQQQQQAAAPFGLGPLGASKKGPPLAASKKVPPKPEATTQLPLGPLAASGRRTGPGLALPPVPASLRRTGSDVMTLGGPSDIEPGRATWRIGARPSRN